MQRILSALGQVFRSFILILGLMSLIGLSSLLISVEQPSFAAASLEQQAQEESIDVLNRGESGKSREEIYEEAAKAAETPQKVVRAEQDEIKAFKKSESGQGLVGGAQNLLDKVTGKE